MSIMQFNRRLNKVNTTEHNSSVGMAHGAWACVVRILTRWRATGRQLFKQVRVTSSWSRTKPVQVIDVDVVVVVVAVGPVSE